MLKDDQSQLKAVTIMVRHGDRTPMASDYAKNSLCDVSPFVNQFVNHYASCLNRKGMAKLPNYSRQIDPN